MARSSTSRGDKESNGGNSSTNGLKKKASNNEPGSRLGLIMRRRRALSAPPSVRRSRLIEEHYRVDDTHTVVLPGVPKHDDDWARDAHDFFNLVVLVRTKRIENSSGRIHQIDHDTMTHRLITSCVNCRSLLLSST